MMTTEGFAAVVAAMIVSVHCLAAPCPALGKAYRMEGEIVAIDRLTTR